MNIFGAQQRQSNEQLKRQSHKSTNKYGDEKLMDSPLKHGVKKKKTPVKPTEEPIFPHDNHKIKAGKRCIVTVRDPITSTVNRANVAKLVPRANGRFPTDSKSSPKMIDLKNKVKIIRDKTDANSSPGNRLAMPIRTYHTAITKPIVAVSIPTHNVMNQVHNVTISSPPSIRMDLEQKESSGDKKVVSRSRMRTRTLEKSEMILLKSNEVSTTSLKTPITMRLEKSNVSQRIHVDNRQSISFEVNFEEENHKRIEKSLPTEKDTTESYEDDFEAYESDFEEDLLPSEPSELHTSSESDENSSFSESEIFDDLSNAKHPFTVNETVVKSNTDSYEMRPIRPMTVDIHRDSDIKLLPDICIQLTCSDSNRLSSKVNLNNSNFFEMKLGVNSLDSSRIDWRNKRKTIRMFHRGAELLKKITLDTVNYVLYDCQPIPYDLFMQIYGRNDTVQVSIQTHNMRMDQDIQLEPIEFSEVWVQYPPTFYSRHMFTNNLTDYKNGCGHRAQNLETIESILPEYVKRLQNYKISTRDSHFREVKAPEIKYHHLNRILLGNEITVSQIIYDKNNHQADSMKSTHFTLELEMNTFKILRIFTSPTLPGFLFTLHHQIGDHLHLISVWNLTFARKPICVLSSWTAVLCIEIHDSTRDLIFAGMDDGLVYYI